MIVIPPGNLITSKDDEFPNRGSVKWIVDCRTTKDMNFDLRMLNHVDDIVMFSGKGTMLKMMFVQFDPSNGCSIFTTTVELGMPTSSYISSSSWDLFPLSSGTVLCSLKLATIAAAKYRFISKDML